MSAPDWPDMIVLPFALPWPAREPQDERDALVQARVRGAPELVVAGYGGEVATLFRMPAAGPAVPLARLRPGADGTLRDPSGRVAGMLLGTDAAELDPGWLAGVRD